MKSSICCPNPGGAIRCSQCRRQQRWHAADCAATPDMLWHARRGFGYVCDPCWREKFGVARPPIPPAIRRAVLARDGMVCQLCSCAVVFAAFHRPDRLHLDHIKRWADGGLHAVDNLRVTCARCNLKRAKVGV